MNFDFFTATRIIFGPGSINQVPKILEETGLKILLVTGKERDRAKSLTDHLSPDRFQLYPFSAGNEPDTNTISEGTALARKTGCQVVVALGGGSAIDSGKAIAALTPNKGELTDYLEVIGLGRKLENHPLPFIAIPTTAGTGAEVTKNAVIHSPEHKVKVSLRSQLMFPGIAVIDPALTCSMPPAITATTGMDALTHLFETFVSNQSNPHVDLFCREGLSRISRSLIKAYEDGTCMEAREDMAYAGMLGGMALANVKLGAVHGFAGPLGGMYPAPHGAVCAALLPAVMEVNVKAIQREGREQTLKKYEEAARILTQNPNAGASDGIEWAQKMKQFLKIPSLSSYGLSMADFPSLIEKAKNASSMKGNPVVLSDSRLTEILEKSI